MTRRRQTPFHPDGGKTGRHRKWGAGIREGSLSFLSEMRNSVSSQKTASADDPFGPQRRWVPPLAHPTDPVGSPCGPFGRPARRAAFRPVRVGYPGADRAAGQVVPAPVRTVRPGGFRLKAGLQHGRPGSGSASPIPQVGMGRFRRWGRTAGFVRRCRRSRRWGAATAGARSQYGEVINRLGSSAIEGGDCRRASGCSRHRECRRMLLLMRRELMIAWRRNLRSICPARFFARQVAERTQANRPDGTSDNCRY
jgi:hypothetical protein